MQEVPGTCPCLPASTSKPLASLGSASSPVTVPGWATSTPLTPPFITDFCTQHVVESANYIQTWPTEDDRALWHFQDTSDSYCNGKELILLRIFRTMGVRRCYCRWEMETGESEGGRSLGCDHLTQLPCQFWRIRDRRAIKLSAWVARPESDRAWLWSMIVGHYTESAQWQSFFTREVGRRICHLELSTPRPL